MKRDYIITSSARTMLNKEHQENLYHVIFIADQPKIQEINRQINQESLLGYHAYKIAEEHEPGKDLIFTSKLLVELQFKTMDEARLIHDILIAEGITPHISDNPRPVGKRRVFEKGDRFSRI